MADLLGIASIIGASATFVGTTGGLWLAASGRTDRRNGDFDHHEDIDDLTENQIAEVLDRRRKQREQKRRGGQHRFHVLVDFLLRREPVIDT